MTAQELLDWSLENIHDSEWRYKMIMKASEEEIKSLTKEQVDAIDWFCKTLAKNKFFMGFGAVVRVSDLQDSLKTIKQIRK